MFGKKKKTQTQQPQKKKEVKRNARGTAGQMVKEVFIKHHATNEKRAIPISAFKDLKLSTPTISYTIANFIEQDVVHQTEDEKYWFDEKEWDKLGKDVVRGYMMILIVPLVIGLIVVVLGKMIFG